jgi:hypothetical protein
MRKAVRVRSPALALCGDLQVKGKRLLQTLPRVRGPAGLLDPITERELEVLRALHPKVFLELSLATKPDHKRMSISPNTSRRSNDPAFDYGIVANDREFGGEVGDWASMNRHDL